MRRALCVAVALTFSLAAVSKALAQGSAAVISVSEIVLPTKMPRTAKAKTAKAKARRSKRKRAVPARKLFGRKKVAAALSPRAIGFYSRGCLAGGEKLAPTGPAWQAMRLSRNRNWAHPALIRMIERLAVEAKQLDGWNGLLVGDLAQPRGGPMLTGHASHQVGLDGDIWLREAPARRLSRKERETFAPISMLRQPMWKGRNKLAVKPDVFSPKHVALIKRAASYREVARVGVNPAIKHALCKAAGGDTPWLRKIQMWPGHHYHMHIRLKCPKGSDGCRDQGVPRNTSCAAAEKWHKNLKAWLARPKTKTKKKKKAKAKKRKRRSEIMMANLPAACRAVLSAKSEAPIAAKAAGK